MQIAVTLTEKNGITEGLPSSITIDSRDILYMMEDFKSPTGAFLEVANGQFVNDKLRVSENEAAIQALITGDLELIPVTTTFIDGVPSGRVVYLNINKIQKVLANPDIAATAVALVAAKGAKIKEEIATCGLVTGNSVIMYYDRGKNLIKIHVTETAAAVAALANTDKTELYGLVYNDVDGVAESAAKTVYVNVDTIKEVITTGGDDIYNIQDLGQTYPQLFTEN